MSQGANDSHHLRNAISSLPRLTVEQLRCHRIVADHHRAVAVMPEQLAELWADTSDEIWIDIQASNPHEFQAFLAMLGLHPLIMEDCLDPNRSSRFSSYETSLHFEVPVLADKSIDDYLSVICVPRMLITIRTSPIPEIDHVLQDLDHQVQLNEATKSALLYTILDALTNRLVLAAGHVRDEIRRLSRSMDAQSIVVDVAKIISVKRRVQDIATVAEDQLYCISALIPIDSNAFPMSHQREYMRDAARNYEAALRVLQRYETRAAELHQQCLSSLQAKTESRLRILTILSTICMPLTLIAGIYGMNFASMPELQTSWGYPATLTGMLAIAIGQLWYFYKRGWFG